MDLSGCHWWEVRLGARSPEGREAAEGQRSLGEETGGEGRGEMLERTGCVGDELQ